MPASTHAQELVRLAIDAAAEKKASDAVAIDVSERLALTDAFVIVSADNERQVQAIADEIDRAMHEAGVKSLRSEGANEGRWILVDYGDIVAHIMHVDERKEYSLERLWADCPQLAGGDHQ